jgi:hypothetical protein
MSSLVTVAVAGDAVEADTICRVLRRSGIEPRLEGAESELGAMPHDGPCRVLVAHDLVDAALQALEDESDGEDEDS